MGKKIPVEEWISLLKDFYKPSTIKNYCSRTRGDEEKLCEITYKAIKKGERRRLYAAKYLSNKERDRTYALAFMAGLSGAGSAHEINYNIYKKQEQAIRYIIESGNLYITEANEVDFIEFIEIIKKYIDKIERISLMKKEIPGKSIYEIEKNALNALNIAQKILNISGHKITLPKSLHLDRLNDIKRLTKHEIECLDIKFDHVHTLDRLLFDLSSL